MNISKKTALLVIGLSVFAISASTALAGSTYTGCVSIGENLSSGSRGAAVSQLQAFLVDQDFPGSGTWMQTGIYGAATAAAVRDFQQVQGLQQSGIVDAVTRQAIARVSCGTSFVSPAQPISPITSIIPVTPANPIAPIWNPYGYNSGSGYSGGYNGNGYHYGNVSLNLTGLSQNTGAVGQQITIDGTGFDAYDNTVYFGSYALSNIASYDNGTQITFTIPSYVTSYSWNGTQVNIYVVDSLGTSNTVTFTVTYNPYACGGIYSYNTYNSSSCGCNNYYGSYPSLLYNGGTNGAYYNCGSGTNGNGGNTNSPTISWLNPNYGATGTSVTVYGSGFTSSGNSVHFGVGIIANILSNDGQTLSFTVPSQLTGFGSQNVGLGTYNVSVTNGNGYSTTAIPFTVTSLNGNGGVGYGSPTISGVTGPTNLTAGSSGTWTVVVNNPSGGYVTVTPQWGDGTTNTASAQSVQASSQATLTFSHTYSSTGTYTITFTASNTTGSNSASATVTVSGSNYGNVPTITSLWPTSATIGQQVTLYGTFPTSGNTINFGTGTIQNVYSQNGSQISFTIPQYITPYCSGTYTCYQQPVTSGTYNISVRGYQGTSNTVSLQVI